MRGKKGTWCFGGGRRILREMCCSAQEKEKGRRTRRHRKGKMANSEEGEEGDVKAKDELGIRPTGGRERRDVNKEGAELGGLMFKKNRSKVGG